MWFLMNMLCGLIYLGVHIWVLGPSWYLVNKKGTVHWLNETLVYDNSTDMFCCTFDDASAMYEAMSMAAAGSLAIAALILLVSAIGLLWAVSPAIECVLNCCHNTFDIATKLRQEKIRSGALEKELELERTRNNKNKHKQNSDISI